MKKGLFILLTLISVSTFAQTKTISQLTQKNAAYTDTLIAQSGNTQATTLGKVFSLFHPGTTAQYMRGDGSLATFPIDNIAFTNGSGYLTSINSSQVTTALGFTPYNATNPNGYITSSALSPYETISHAGSTYATITGLNSYLLSATAASTYATQSALATTNGNVSANTTAIAGKQATLVSGTNIKTINGTPILGSGDLTIASGGTATDTTPLHAQILANTAAITADKQKLSKFRVPTRFIGTVIPVFQSTAGFENLGNALGTQFSIASGGGLITSSAGTTASGYLQLPRPVSTIYTTRTDWLISWDLSETGASMTFALDSATSKYSVTLANVGGNFQATFYKIDGTQVNSSDNIGTGIINVCVSIATGNGGVTASVHILNNLSLANGNKWKGGINMQYQRFNSARINMAYFATNAASSKIVGFLHNAQGLDGDPNGVLLTRTAIMNLGGNILSTNTTQWTDNENVMVIPERADITTPLKAMVFFHGRSLYMLDALIDTTGKGDYGATARAMVQAGYAFVAQQGGFGTSNRYADWWGNPTGLERMKQVYDTYNQNVSNIGKLYLFGWSMGGVCALNFHKQYPGLVAAMELITPVTNLEDSAATYGVQIGSTLKSSTDAAYQKWYISQIVSNVGNNPTTDDGTKWQTLAEAGALPDVGARSYQVTTTSAASANQLYADVSSSAAIPVGSYVYFRASRQMRRVVYRAAGVPNRLNLDAPVTVISGEPVCAVYLKPNGEPDAQAMDFIFANFFGGTVTDWVSGTTYAIGSVTTKNSSHPELDVKPWNPFRFPETFNIPIEVAVAGDGTSTGNDGILANKMMYDFRTIVNAIYPNKVTIRVGAGSAHIAGALSASTTLAYFNQF